MNSSYLNNPYTASVGDSPPISDAAICSEDLNNPRTALPPQSNSLRHIRGFSSVFRVWVCR